MTVGPAAAGAPDVGPAAAGAPDADVVVVGAGVAGSAVAARLATAGLGVVVLEREAEYTDRVRGEGMVPWGLEAAAALGLADAVANTPGVSFMTTLVAYDELVSIERARRRARSLADLVPGVPGLVAVGHPELRQSLADAAASAGAAVLRPTTEVTVDPGPAPEVAFTFAGRRHRLRPRLVIVADGKESTIRRSLGIELASTIPTMMLTGMLVDDGGVWDRAEVTIGVHGENQLYVFPRVGALRLYAGRMVGADRFSGPDRATRMLEAFRGANLPHAEELAGARPIGPCATYPMTDTWTRNPVLSEELLSADVWDDALLDRYAGERFERMRRLRFASALTDVFMAQGVPDRAERKARMDQRVRQDPQLLEALGAVHAGPWRVREDAFEPSYLAILAGA